MGALLGYVVDIVVGAVMGMDEVDNVMKGRVIRALNKVVWIQNDLFARHYLRDPEVGQGVGEATPPSEEEEVVGGGKAGGCPFAA